MLPEHKLRFDKVLQFKKCHKQKFSETLNTYTDLGKYFMLTLGLYLVTFAISKVDNPGQAGRKLSVVMLGIEAISCLFKIIPNVM